MSRFRKNLIVIVLLVSASFVIANFALAQGVDVGLEYGEQIGLGSTDPRIVVANIIRIALGFLGIIAVGLIIYAGWLYMTAAGQEEKIAKAKKILIGAIIGLVIILSSFAIASFILSKLMEATGTGTGPGGEPSGCTDGDTQSCGCGGLRTCISGGWGGCIGSTCPGVCSPACSGATPYCCASSCQATPCSGPISCDSVSGGACDADATLCAEDYYCETSSCTCQAGGGFGESCDSDGGTTTCEADNNLCSAYLTCNTGTCTCLGAPVIEWISPIDGAKGNLVTIGGRYFGTTTPGQVYFADSTGIPTILASFPNSINANCDNNWQDNQIIVIVPNGAVTGPIKVITSDAREDTTDNDRGPNLDDFVVNDVARPGLCKINPSQGKWNDVITYYGLGLSGGLAYFGNQSAKVAGLNSVFSGPAQGIAKVPDIGTGQTTTFVANNDIFSNYLNFTKNAEPNIGPAITSFEPNQGKSGQYVTIYGRGFGGTRGTTNHVYFKGATQTEASYQFPEICAESVWSENQVIVKVPEGLADGNYTLAMEIGDQTATASGSFKVDNSLDLTPSLCKIEPIMGPNNTPISLWGENFGNQATGLVRFNSNKDQTGSAISFWGDEDDAQKAVTTVHQEAIIGPVKIVQNGLASNGMNFKVGSCTEDKDCGDSQVCCPAGSSEAGRCKTDEDACYVAVASSVYEWEFSTGEVVPPTPPTYYSCLGISEATGKCDPLTCPNSPGKCSPYGGGLEQAVGDCGDAYCSSVRDGCTYNNILNKCVDPVQGDCDLNNPSLTTDALGNEIVAYCAEYNSNSRWHINTNLSCPSGWTSIFGGKCVDTDSSCGLCDSGFVCLDDKDSDLKGLCAVDQDICPSGSTCNASNKCISTDKATCECCCEIGQDARDCCSPLTCEGNCGSDASGTDTNTYGYCSGCANVGTTQAAHDAACNCEGAGGKICDTSVAGGICRDCEGLSLAECSTHTTCCVDATNGNICRGGTGNTDIVNYNDLAYCEYYQCSAGGNACDSNPVASSTKSVYGTREECGTKCSQASRPGERCISADKTTCSTTFCGGDYYSCLGVSAGDCGICCCNPLTPQSNENGLRCVADKSPCDGTNRGLYCGCEKDQDCGSSIDTVGCASDTCCRKRPEVLATYPADAATGVCLNTLVSANFNEKMDIASFSGNVVVAGDYGNSVCPAGTQYLALGDGMNRKRNVVTSFYQKILSILAKVVRPLFGGKVLADTPDPAHNYCAITGTVNGINRADGKTDLIFSLNRSLDQTRKYYVIIKGDEDLDSSKGVLSNWKIGMNENDAETFGGQTFTRAKIWSFRTGSDICQLSSVTIEPTSYLFQTNKNNTGDDVVGDSFDTIADSDKVFYSRAISNNGQQITPIAGDYNWEWSWSSDNSRVAEVSNSNSPLQTVTAQNVKDGKTFIKATATITEDTIMNPRTVGQAKTGQAEVYVFLCENPWPPVNEDTGNWAPWRDNCLTCDDGTGSCENKVQNETCGDGSGKCKDIGGKCFITNYELYYCRDRGAAGSVDDLPAILSKDTIIRGKSDIQDILKEAYFFREELPNVSGINLTVASIPSEGGIVNLSWSPILVPAKEELANYKIYYGTSSGQYNEQADAGKSTSYTVDNLTNNQTYYFSIIAQYTSGAVSGYSNEVSATPKDTVGPAAPTMTLAPGDGRVVISWTDNSGGEAVSFRVYYRATTDCSPDTDFGGSSQPIANSPAAISSLNNGTAYCFGLVAYDVEGNQSDIVIGSATPAAPAQ